jgi:hypothetical protein
MRSISRIIAGVLVAAWLVSEAETASVESSCCALP